jgi:alanine dehydrogenase
MSFWTAIVGIIAIGMIGTISMKIIDGVSKGRKEKRDNEMKKLEIQKSMAELEVRKQEAHARELEAENQQYDLLIAKE